MNTTTKILAAFAVATIAGTVLGMLLSSSEDSKLKNIIAESKKGNGSFIDKLFRRKKDSVLTGEYEQA